MRNLTVEDAQQWTAVLAFADDIITWGNFTAAFVDDLAARLDGRRVLEVFAGNGRLAQLLAERGVSVTSTSRFTGHDGHERGMYFPVFEIDAVDAVMTFGNDADVLLMCWPTVTSAALRAAVAWGPARDIFFIGEWTDYTKGNLGGCATDEFFEAAVVQSDINSYSTLNALERAVVLHIDMAAVMRRASRS
jgi:hypothetical protein